MKVAQSGTPFQINAPLNFLQIAAQSNSLISALNTNALVGVNIYDHRDFRIYVESTYYFDANASDDTAKWGSPCYLKSSTVPAGFYLSSYYTDVHDHQFWPCSSMDCSLNASAVVNGFFGSCTPLDALLASTFDCLYNDTCLQIYSQYFPAFNRVCLMMKTFVFYTKSLFI